jgi:hypothetical protein
MQYLFFMGAKVRIDQVIGIGPLAFTEGVMGGVEFKEYSFDLLLIHYSFRFSTGRLRPEPFDTDPTTQLREFRRLYNELAAGLDHFEDTSRLPTELACEKIEQAARLFAANTVASK